jgi:hypothetical protein
MWLKLSDDFGDECARLDLSDSAFRTLVESLLWVMRRETGGLIDSIDIRRFAESPHVDGAVDELVSKGCWVETPNGHQVCLHMQHQVEPEVIARRREKDAERQRRHRAKAAGSPSKKSDAMRDTSNNEMRDPGLVWSGRVRTGQSQLGEAKERMIDDGCRKCGPGTCSCW